MYKFLYVGDWALEQIIQRGSGSLIFAGQSCLDMVKEQSSNVDDQSDQQFVLRSWLLTSARSPMFSKIAFLGQSKKLWEIRWTTALLWSWKKLLICLWKSVQVGYKEKFHLRRGVRRWYKLPWEVKSPSLEVLKKRGDVALRDMESEHGGDGLTVGVGDFSGLFQH